ncbi:MAG: hypothetical protein MUF75_05810 [Bacteroidia bacterium]|nr:hypothetical protein [Bacteroidia bacterium]
MKLKSIVTAILLLTICAFKKEETIYQEIVRQVQLDYPGFVTGNKLLLLNFISDVPDQVELEKLKEMNRTLEVFKYARLKGGEQGILGVVVCSGSTRAIKDIFKNQGIHAPLYLFCSYDEWSKRFGSALQSGALLFDKEGALLNSQLTSETIFSTVHNRITR